jgi:hypothetical protein
MLTGRGGGSTSQHSHATHHTQWVHTYVSVILAIMGAIFLCVLLTVLKIFCAPYLARHPATFRMLFWRAGRGPQGRGGGFQMATVSVWETRHWNVHDVGWVG